MQVKFVAHGIEYILSTEHSQSRDGLPVLVTPRGDRLGRWDVIKYSRYCEWTGGAIAGLLRSIKRPGEQGVIADDPEVQAMLAKYESVPFMDGFSVTV